MQKEKKPIWKLRFTQYGWNIYRDGRKIEGPIEEEWRANSRLETLKEREQ